MMWVMVGWDTIFTSPMNMFLATRPSVEAESHSPPSSRLSASRYLYRFLVSTGLAAFIVRVGEYIARLRRRRGRGY